jgi:hypothetical protein
MLSTPTDLNVLRRLIALKISDSETGVNDTHSEDDERVGKTTGEGLWYTD